MVRKLALLPILLCIPGLIVAQDSDPGDHLRGVARYLRLDEGQVEAVTSLLESRRSQITPLRQEMRRLGRVQRELLQSDEPNPTSVGEIVLAIQDLRQQIQQIQREVIEAFEGLLTEEQLGRYRAVRRASRLARVLPGFKALGLI